MKTNRFINIKVALFIAVSALMAACTIEDADQSVEPKSEQLDIAEELNMTASETDKSFDVTSDSGWDVSIEGGWTGLTVSPMSGSGKSQVTIHTDANTTRQGREATISIKTKGGVTQKMVVKQALSDVILNVTGGESQTLEYEASPQDPKKFSFTCNSTWEVTSSDSWIKCADPDGKTSGGSEVSTVVSTTISVSVDEIQTEIFAVLVDGFVYFVDVQQTLAPSQRKTRQTDSLVAKNPLQINVFLSYFLFFHHGLFRCIQSAKIQIFFYIETNFY